MWTSTISAQNSRKRRDVMVQRSYSNLKACHVSSRGSARASDCVRVIPSSSPPSSGHSARRVVRGRILAPDEWEGCYSLRAFTLFDTHDLSGRGRNPRPHIPWDVRASLAYMCCGAGALPPGTSHVLHAYISIFWVYISFLVERDGFASFLNVSFFGLPVLIIVISYCR